MLFCSKQFLIFFTVIFAVYWAMPRKWFRLGFLLAAGGLFGYEAWNFLKAMSWLGWPTQFAKGNFNVFPEAAWAGWLAGIVALGLLLAFRIGHDRARVWLLLLASFYFYSSWNHWLALLICVTTFMDYVVARGLAATEAPPLRKLMLGLSLVVNLGAGYALDRPAIGVLSGAILILVGSTRAVRRTLRRADHAVAAP